MGLAITPPARARALDQGCGHGLVSARSRRSLFPTPQSDKLPAKGLTSTSMANTLPMRRSVAFQTSPPPNCASIDW